MNLTTCKPTPNHLLVLSGELGIHYTEITWGLYSFPSSLVRTNKIKPNRSQFLRLAEADVPCVAQGKGILACYLQVGSSHNYGHLLVQIMLRHRILTDTKMESQFGNYPGV